ncbi:MAG: glycosyltransferase family 8 protein [Acutalibacteraceae bacterium]
MNVVYSASDLYSSLAGISLTSLLMNNTDVDKINVIIMDNEISDENKAKLKATADRYNRDIRFVPLSASLENTDINLQKWNISTFGRLFEASSLPDVDKVIHIDCDTVVDGSLKDLWELDMSHAIVAGAPDCLSDDYKFNIGLMPDDTYINAGIIVMNLQRIRELGIENLFLKYISEKSKLLTYVDQEVLNSCVPEEEKIEIPLRYNSYSILHYLSYKRLKSLRHVNHMFSEKIYTDAVENATVLHYTGCFLEGTRPWIEGDKHPKRVLFDHYKAASEWADMMPWKDNRSALKKFMSLAVKLIPKFVLAPVVGYIHGVYIPRRNKKRQEGN